MSHTYASGQLLSVSCYLRASVLVSLQFLAERMAEAVMMLQWGGRGEMELAYGA